MPESEVLRPNLSDSLTERVLGLIRQEGLRPGDRLPPIRELSRRFEVTAPTLREVLRRLEATGGILMRHGSGIFVGPAIGRIVLPNPNVRQLHGVQLLDLLEARLLIEPPLARLAAGRSGTEECAALRAVLDDAARHLNGDDALLHEANMAFHRAAARAAGNVVLDEVIDSLLTVHAHEQREILRIFDDRVRDYQEHRAVLEAIEAGDVDAAEELMRAHLADAKDVIGQRLGEETT